MIDENDKGGNGYDELVDVPQENDGVNNKEPIVEKNNEENNSDHDISNGHVEVKMNKLPSSNKKKFVQEDNMSDLNDSNAIHQDINETEQLDESKPASSRQQSTEVDDDHRQDRFGLPIISRTQSKKNNIKSNHKLTFVDQIQNQVNKRRDEGATVQELGDRTIYIMEANKNQKIIQLAQDKTRSIINIHYIESQKKYNAMELDELDQTNTICKCNIF